MCFVNEEWKSEVKPDTNGIDSVSCQEGSAESIRCQGKIVPPFELALTVKMIISFSLVCIFGLAECKRWLSGMNQA